MNQAAFLYLSLSDYVDPLRRGLSSVEALEHLFFRYGWTIGLDEAVYGRIDQALGIAPLLREVLQTADELREKLAGEDSSELSVSDIASLAGRARPLLSALARFRPTELSQLPEPLDQEQFWNDIAEHLPDDLMEEYLRIHHQAAYVILHVWGVIRYDARRPAGPHRRPYIRTSVDWGTALDALREPAASLQRTYNWGDAAKEFDHRRFLEALARVVRALHVPVVLGAPSPDRPSSVPHGSGFRPIADAQNLLIDLLYRPFARDLAIYEIGAELFPAVTDGDSAASGLLIKLLARGGLGKILPLASGFGLRWAATASEGDAVALGMFPGQVRLAEGAAAVGAAVEIFSTAPWFLLGTAHTAHIEVAGFSLRLSIEGSVDHPETRLHLRTSGANGEPGCRVVVPLDQADGFLKETLQREPIELRCDFDLMWSSESGLTFNGRPTLDIELPFNVNVGGFEVTRARIAVGEADNTTTASRSIAVRTSLDIHGTVGPLQIAIDNVGFVGVLTPYTREEIRSLPADADPPVLGHLDVRLDFAPPRGIGLSIAASGIVGAGYLSFDPLEQEYAGILQLQLAETIALTAVGLLTTRLPDGSKGFSLIIIITAEDFPPIQLGLGFRLTGVGGLIGVNRTVAVDVLRAGLKKGALDAVLFPTDPLHHPGEIVSNIRKVFPPAAGRYVFGPMVTIEWGTPPVLRMELAVILELPSPARLILLGQVRGFLPREAKALVRLKMDVLGVLEIDKGALAIDAVLYDSRMLTFAVTGDMALRLRWLTDPTFVMSVGGLNPAFKPPPDLPALKRLAISLTKGDNPRLRLEAYLALTSNTAQIGARLDLRVAAAGFSIEGYLYFDALFQFSPFQFNVEIGGGVTLQWHGRTLLGVQLQLTLSGPSPWHARGKATFKIWIFSKSVSFDHTFGKDERPPLLPPADPLPDLLAALGDVRSWAGTVPSGCRTLVGVRATTAGTLLLHPLAALAVRQRVVPLDIEITKFGNTVPAGERRFRITAVQLGDRLVPRSRLVTVTEHFAAGQFLQLSDAESLSRPSFEPLPSGVALPGEGVNFGGRDAPGLTAIVADASYDTLVVARGGARERRTGGEPLSRAALLAGAEVGAAARAWARRPGVSLYAASQRDGTPAEPISFAGV